MPDPLWIVMPILADRDRTIAAIGDCLAQTLPTRLLLVNQGVDDAFRTELELLAEAEPTRVFLWSHQPPLPSLAASWNRALDFVWDFAPGAPRDAALVVNNDVRLHPSTAFVLRGHLREADALFVSAVGVGEAEWHPEAYAITADHGGPDFSCFLITRDCHTRFRFDEHFTPAYCEDLDYHRRLLLAGEGQRIYSINVPYLHYGAGTLATMDAPARGQVEQAINAGSRAYYARKWGGPVNQERFVLPFGGGWSQPAAQDGVTTPELEARLRAGEPMPAIDTAWLGQQGNFEPHGGGADGQTA